VMTLDTTHFGRVQVEARAVDNRLIVKLRAPTADAVDVLSAYGTEVRAAIEQLGWSVDELTYELAEPARAARAVVDHVLSAGSVDQEL
jgi:ribosome-binding protein aMBF1 (putative translation factor)